MERLVDLPRNVRLDVRELNRIVNGIKRDYVSDRVFCSMAPQQTIPFLRTVADGSTSVCGFRKMMLFYNDTHFEWAENDEPSDLSQRAILEDFKEEHIKIAVEATPSKGLSELIREGVLNCDGKRLFVELTLSHPSGGHAVAILIDFSEKSVDVFDVNGTVERDVYLPIIEENVQSRGFKIKKTDEVCTIPINHYNKKMYEICKGYGMCVAAQTLNLMLRLLVPMATNDTVYEFMLFLDPNFLQTFAYFVNTKVGKTSDYVRKVGPKGTQYVQVGLPIYSPVSVSGGKNLKLTNKRKTVNSEEIPEYSLLFSPEESDEYEPFNSRRKRARYSPRTKT